MATLANATDVVVNSCTKGLEDCRNKDEALHLKIVAIAAILIACVLGVCMPLLGRSHKAFKAESFSFFVAKSFAAGVILATGFVHMLPDAFEALTSTCLPEAPWSKFPFAGFVAMMAALFTLMIDFWGTAYYERKHAHGKSTADEVASHEAVNEAHKRVSSLDEEIGEGLSMVTVHTHTTSQAHLQSKIIPEEPHSGSIEETSKLRHRVISQVLELGIVAHSVIIGISLGTSESPCTIRPLIAALSFHQFFEGMALGGCIAQAGFKSRASAIMGFFFSVTTPAGIAIGIGISSSYNENSPRALIVEGIFDSMSAGILVYMSLVDLIANDFMSKKMQSNSRLQVFSYIALFLGAGAMSLIAKWA